MPSLFQGNTDARFVAGRLRCILIGPVADGSTGTATLFDVVDRRAPVRKLKRPGDIVWLRYKVWSAATASRSFPIFERPARKD